jgi:hypothetical protein
VMIVGKLAKWPVSIFDKLGRTNSVKLIGGQRNINIAKNVLINQSICKYYMNGLLSCQPQANRTQLQEISGDISTSTVMVFSASIVASCYL